MIKIKALNNYIFSNLIIVQNSLYFHLLLYTTTYILKAYINKGCWLKDKPKKLTT